MRDRPDPRLESDRIRFGHYNSNPGETWGSFLVNGPCGRKLKILSSGGNPENGWEHVSISTAGSHPPNWQEMCWVKEKFWRDDETVVQFHPRKADYVNVHPNCLHLWRKVGPEPEMPPKCAV